MHLARGKLQVQFLALQKKKKKLNNYQGLVLAGWFLPVTNSSELFMSDSHALISHSLGWNLGRSLFSSWKLDK
jgi:hypothetical protein